MEFCRLALNENRSFGPVVRSKKPSVIAILYNKKINKKFDSFTCFGLYPTTMGYNSKIKTQVCAICQSHNQIHDLLPPWGSLVPIMIYQVSQLCWSVNSEVGIKCSFHIRWKELGTAALHILLYQHFICGNFKKLIVVS